MPIKINKSKIAAAANGDLFDAPEEQTVAVDPRDSLVARAKMKNPPSEFQIDIFEFLDLQINNYRSGAQTSGLAVEAVAGSGKTTTIVGAANIIPRDLKCLFLAFNKSIAEELGERLPSHVQARTLNSLGHGLLMPYIKALGVPRPDLRANRTAAICRSVLTFQEGDEYGKFVKFLVNMCKSMGIAPVGVADAQGINGVEATDEVLNGICIHHQQMIDPVIRPTVFAKTRQVLKQSFSDTDLIDSGCIDYDDQKYLTVCKRPNGRTLAKPQYDVIFIDEVQDVNAVDIEMIKMVLKPNGIIIGVGDSHQAIYGFRGADTEAFNMFAHSFQAKPLPLSITYRCSQAIVKWAQKLVPSIRWADHAPEGAVEHHSKLDLSIFRPHDLVLCRNNAPLIDFAYKLVAERIPVFVMGRKIGDGLIRLINDCVAEKKWVPNPRKPGKKMPVFTVESARVPKLRMELNHWLTQQIEMIREDDPDNEDAVQRVEDQYNSVMVFVNANTTGMVQDVVEEIESMFSDEMRDNAVVCATIHKSKGLEAERVFIYRSELMYPKYIFPDTWQYQQEANLDYVARTRAKTLLAYIPEG